MTLHRTGGTQVRRRYGVGARAVTGFFPATSTFGALVPSRLLETLTDPNLTTVDGLFQGVGTVAADTTLKLQIGGRGGIPAAAAAAVLNVTAVNPRAKGFLMVWACGQRPNASSVNFEPGQTVASAVISEIDPTGKVCVCTNAGTEVLIDVTGFFPP
jgi:trimeric autotransporter adhesin